MDQIDVIAKWQPTNLLNGVEDKEKKQAIAETLEAAARHLVGMWTFMVEVGPY